MTAEQEKTKKIVGAISIANSNNNNTRKTCGDFVLANFV